MSVKALRPKEHMMIDPSAIRRRTIAAWQMTAESIQRTRVDVSQGAAIALQELPEMSRSTQIPYRAAMRVAILFESVSETIDVWPTETCA